MIYALTAFSLLCLACAVFFALDYYRMRSDRDGWRDYAEDIADESFRLIRELRGERPSRDPKTGRFTKRRG